MHVYWASFTCYSWCLPKAVCNLQALHSRSHADNSKRRQFYRICFSTCCFETRACSSILSSEEFLKCIRSLVSFAFANLFFSWWLLQAEALLKVKLKINAKDEVEGKSVTQEELLSICLNPNVLTDFKLAGDPEVWFFSECNMSLTLNASRAVQINYVCGGNSQTLTRYIWNCRK